MSGLVETHDSGAVRTLRLNDPDSRNAFTPDVRDELLRLLDDAERDDAIGALVLTGAGPGFSGGGDTRAMGQVLPRDKHRSMLRSARLAERLATIPKPVVAAVHGYAIGAGLSLALACDLLVVERGTKLRTAFRQMGLIPDLGAHWYLVSAFGPARAKRIIWQDLPITVEDAQGAGLVAQVTAPGDGYVAALALATELAAGPRDVTAVSKSIIASTYATQLGEVLAAEALGSSLLRTTPDHAEAVAARREKREPRFGPSGQDPAISG